MVLPTCAPYLWEAEAVEPQLPFWDPLKHKYRNSSQVGGLSLGLASASSLSSMFGNSEQKLAINEIYILASPYKRHKDIV